MRRTISAKAVILVVVALSLFAAVPVVAAQDAATNEPRPLEVTLERLAGLLTRLETEVAAVDRPAADRLEQQVTEAVGLVEDVLTSLGGETEEGVPAKRAARLDLTLHRLVALLEEIVGEPRDRPERAKARMTLDELRTWVDGYVAAAAAGMSARDAERFDRAAHDLARALAAQLARVAEKAPATEQGKATLPRVVARLEALTQKLDELLLRRIAAPNADQPTP
jgi:hypothetical protein